MNDFLQLIGSLASIIGVPLAIYLYLKGLVQKYAEVRREIVKRLSHQIGEGRSISIFELNAIIDSLVREKRLKPGSISSNSVIEDLIAETVSSPLLESTKKESLVKELSEVHTLGKIFNSINEDEEVFNKFIEHLGQESEVGRGTAEEIEKQLQTATQKTVESSKAPEVFGVIASFITVIAASFTVAGFSESLDIIPKLFDSSIITSLGLAIAGSILAGLATLAMAFLSRKQNNK